MLIANVFPNPINDVLNINISSTKINDEYLITLMNVYGRILYQTNHYYNEIKLNLTNLNSGFYILEIRNKNNEKMIQKIIKN